MTNTTKSRSKPPVSSRSTPHNVVPPPLNNIPDDIAAEVEAELAKQRASLVAKKLEERRIEEARLAEAKRKEEAKLARAAERRRRAETKLQTSVDAHSTQAADMAEVKMALQKAGVIRTVTTTTGEEAVWDVPENDYDKTSRVQLELNALLDLLGTVRVSDVVEHIRREDGKPMTESNVRYHMRKLSNRGIVKKVEERFYVKGGGWRTRDVWSKDPQKLLEILEGKKTVRS